MRCRAPLPSQVPFQTREANGVLTAAAKGRRSRIHTPTGGYADCHWPFRLPPPPSHPASPLTISSSPPPPLGWPICRVAGAANVLHPRRPVEDHERKLRSRTALQSVVSGWTDTLGSY